VALRRSVHAEPPVLWSAGNARDETPPSHRADINGHREEEHVAQALERLRERTGMLKVFGSYPRWQP